MKALLAILVFFLSFCTLAQDAATLARLKKDRAQRKLSASENIVLLKGGVLLVRLDLQQRRIDYFTKYNNMEEVERVKAKMLEENKAIMDAFKTYYTFTPVYFFSMEDSEILLKSGIEELTFYNEDVAPDPALHPSSEVFFIADFSFIEQDTTAFLSAKTPTPNQENNPEGRTYYGGSKTTKPALVLRDDRMTQLREPFPFYYGYTYFGRVQKRYRNPVMRWQKQLDDYYQKVMEADTPAPEAN